MQPLGSPVVPEVYRTLMRVSGSGTGQAGSGSVNRLAKLGVSGQSLSRAMSRIGSPVSLTMAAAISYAAASTISSAGSQSVSW